jgi:hypothetical protein
VAFRRTEMAFHRLTKKRSLLENLMVNNFLRIIKVTWNLKFYSFSVGDREKISQEPARGCAPEKILGLTDASGEFSFLVQWSLNDAEMVPSSVARVKWPQLVIDFYENHVEFRMTS